MVSEYNKENYTYFLKEVVNYLINHEDNIALIQNDFKTFILDDNNIANSFVNKMVTIREMLKADLDFFMISDPAIDSMEEVILAYPGYKAIVCYRIAHELYLLGLKLQARFISELAHSATGIDIHPASIIESPFFIDHGTGIVIGETTIIGKRVKLYQGVTLGAKSIPDAKLLKGKKRHPTILDNVTIYACATILGDIVIGNNCIIGANVFLVDSIKDNMIVTIGAPQLIIKEKK